MSTTYRSYFITAESAEKAEEIAWEEMDTDWEIPSAWKASAELSFCEEQMNPPRTTKIKE